MGTRISGWDATGEAVFLSEMVTVGLAVAPQHLCTVSRKNGHASMQR